MNDSEFRWIEQQLGVRLPELYCKVMRGYPFAHGEVEALVDNPVFVVETSRELPAHSSGELLSIGSDGDYGYYCLALHDTGIPVFHFGDGTEITPLNVAFEVWFSKLRSWFVGFNADAAARKYRQLKDAVTRAGFYVSHPSPMMGGQDRVIVSTALNGMMPAGRFFWMRLWNNEWRAGDWDREFILDNQLVIQFAIEFLNDQERSGSGFDRTKWRFFLREVSLDEVQSEAVQYWNS